MLGFGLLLRRVGSAEKFSANDKLAATDTSGAGGIDSEIGASLTLGLGRLLRCVGSAEKISRDNKLGANDTSGVGGIESNDGPGVDDGTKSGDSIGLDVVLVAIDGFSETTMIVGAGSTVTSDVSDGFVVEGVVKGGGEAL